jgi:hypothetical protein
MDTSELQDIEKRSGRVGTPRSLVLHDTCVTILRTVSAQEGTFSTLQTNPDYSSSGYPCEGCGRDY